MKTQLTTQARENVWHVFHCAATWTKELGSNRWTHQRTNWKELQVEMVQPAWPFLEESCIQRLGRCSHHICSPGEDICQECHTTMHHNVHEGILSCRRGQHFVMVWFSTTLSYKVCPKLTYEQHMNKASECLNPRWVCEQVSQCKQPCLAEWGWNWKDSSISVQLSCDFVLALCIEQYIWAYRTMATSGPQLPSYCQAGQITLSKIIGIVPWRGDMKAATWGTSMSQIVAAWIGSLQIRSPSKPRRTLRYSPL